MLQGLVDILVRLNDVEGLIRWGGVLVLIAVVYAETGLFVGFFLPGDSLLVTAGLFAARGDLSISVLFVSVCLAAILGDATGFEIGRLSGQAFFSRPNSRLFKREHVEKTRLFYERYGARTILLARFMPIIRTFAPLVAGVAGMPYRQFAAYNILGGIAWVGSMLSIGYGLGSTIPTIDRSIHLVIGVVIFISLLPALIGYARSRWGKR